MLRPAHLAFLATFAVALPVLYPGPAGAEDVRSSCTKAGDDDKVRPIPAALVPQARRLFEFSVNTPDALVRKGTSYRCMGGKVWLCNYGANLVCEKANTKRTSKGAAEFCRQNPSSDFVPMAATGHDTIYEWKCAGSTAQISRQIATVDPRGFIAGNWKELK